MPLRTAAHVQRIEGNRNFVKRSEKLLYGHVWSKDSKQLTSATLDFFMHFVNNLN